MTKETSKSSIPVVHFIGNGRSGTTLLNMVLDNHPQITGVGELTYLTRHTWREGAYCSCGQRGDVCPFWATVYQQWVEQTGIDGIQDYIALQRMFERYKQVPRLLRERRNQSAQFQTFAEHTTKLLRSIQAVSGVPIVADSSKHPVRAWALSMMPEIDLYLIFLVRDVRGVVWSNKKSFQKDLGAGVGWDAKSLPVWKSAVRWQTVNLFSEWVLNRVDKSLLVRYEDLVNAPRQTLIGIGDFIGVDFHTTAEAFALGQELTAGHIAAGNRLRMQSIRLRTDVDWISKMPAGEQAVAWALSGWLMRRYGYNKSY